MVLAVSSKLTPDIINKGLKVSKIYLEKSLELWPSNQSDALIAVLVLGSFEADGTTEKYGSKRGTIYPYDTCNFKIIFTLLTKVVAIHMRFSKISLCGFSLEWVLL